MAVGNGRPHYVFTLVTFFTLQRRPKYVATYVANYVFAHSDARYRARMGVGAVRYLRYYVIPMIRCVSCLNGLAPSPIRYIRFYVLYVASALRFLLPLLGQIRFYVFCVALLVVPPGPNYVFTFPTLHLPDGWEMNLNKNK